MKILSFLLMFFLAIGITYSQETVETPMPQSASLLKDVKELPEKGTYQVMVNHKDLIVNISNETLYEVRRKRLVDENAYIIVNENVKIKILPYKVIRAKDFNPVNEYHYEN